MKKNCEKCSIEFEITDEDLKFYDKVSPVFGGKKYAIPAPTLCPDCRCQRRFAFRNERNLYKRKCDLSGKDIISVYPSDSKFKVYEQNEWWGDKWDALDYGVDFDFGKSFFEQFADLIAKVPKMNLSANNNENCDYINYSNYCKDSYLIFGCQGAENCAYSWRIHYSLECFDCAQLDDCKYCYECIDCDHCYELLYSQNCQNCSQSRYLSNSIGCSNCFMSCNLNHKQYYVLNEKYSKEDYEKKVSELLKKDRNELFAEFVEYKKKFPCKAVNQISCQNCSGDYLVECKNCENVFSAKKCEDLKNIYLSEKAKDCMDCDIIGWPSAELCYDSISVAVNAVRNLFSNVCWTCNDIFYCESCFNSHDLFGCTGLRHKEYCIFNKQYAKEEYEKLVPKIIQHMEKTGEWGEFFPMKLSPFSYGESVASELYPLEKSEVLRLGLRWRDAENHDKQTGFSENVLVCEVTGRSYKLTKSEIDFYKKFNLPLPKKCPDQRHKERIGMRNPKKLWKRKCDKCGKGIETSYAPDRPEKVYCEDCYLKEIY